MRRIVLICLLALLAGSAQAAHLQMEKVTASVYMVRPVEGDTSLGRAVSNAAFIVLPDRVLLFDTLSSRELMVEMMQLITSVTPLPVNIVVLSHWHRDHTGGLEYFTGQTPALAAAPGTLNRFKADLDARRIFLDRQIRDLAAKSRAETDPKRAAELEIKARDLRLRQDALLQMRALKAEIEVGGYTELAPGGKVLFLNSLSPAHTVGDLVVVFPEEKVLLAGDVVSVRTLPNLADAYFDNWMTRLDLVSKMNVETIVPGHGPVGTRSNAKALRNYLVTLRKMVEPYAEKGSQQDILEKLRVPPPYDTWDAPDLWFPAAMKVLQEMKRTSAANSAD